MPARRIVRCECGWWGQRTQEGGPCPVCRQPAMFSSRRVRRIPVRTRVLPETVKAFSSEEMGRILDEAAAKPPP